jgi:hypothetical protein
MVVLGILMMVLTIVAQTAILGTRQSGSSQIRLENSAQARVGMEAMSKSIRTTVLPAQLLDTTCTGCLSSAVISANGTSVTFYGNLNNTGVGPSRVRYEVVQDGTKPLGNIVETVWNPIDLGGGQYTFCTPGPGCASRSRVLSRGLLWPSPQLFYYYDNAGTELDSFPLSASDLAKVDSMDLSVQVRTSKAYGTPATTLLLRVAMPNADINIRPTATPTP